MEGEEEEEEEKLELAISASFSEISLSDASSTTHILTAAPCLVTALLGLSNNTDANLCFNACLFPFWLNPYSSI